MLDKGKSEGKENLHQEITPHFVCSGPTHHLCHSLYQTIGEHPLPAFLLLDCELLESEMRALVLNSYCRACLRP